MNYSWAGDPVSSKVWGMRIRLSLKLEGKARGLFHYRELADQTQISQMAFALGL
jgi:hypothetical protein